MAEKWVESPRGRTHYWISRRPGAPVLVFLHPLAADHTLFDRQAEELQALRKSAGAVRAAAMEADLQLV